MSRAHKAKMAEKKAAKSAETAIAPAAPAGPAGPRAVYTIGYAPGLTFEQLAVHVARHGIATVIDTRSPTLAKSEDKFSGVDLKAFVEAQGARCLQWCSTPKIMTAIDTTQGNVLLLRKEKFTYESKLHLEFARHAIVASLPLFHLFEDEVIEAKTYATALDTGAEEYDCERFVTDETAPIEA